MKKISSNLYVVEPTETVTFTIDAVNTAHLVNASMDGAGLVVPQNMPFHFQAASEKGTTHNLVFLFTFSSNSGGAYNVKLTGTASGSSSFEVDQPSGGTVSSYSLIFRVGSVEDHALGIGPPMPWPQG
jgi:hypothetical protein